MGASERRELDAVVAVRLMGWQWFRSRTSGRCMLQPPERDGWVRSPWGEGYAEAVEGVPPLGERFSDWDDGGRNLTRAVTTWGLPRFSEDIAAAWQVHQVMCGQLFSERLAYYRELQLIASKDSIGTVLWPDVLTVLAGRMPEAICLAALKATEKKAGAV